MSYYILPKTNHNFIINITFSRFKINTYTSHSLHIYYKNMYSQLENICSSNLETETSETIDKITKIINPYEFIFSKVPGSKFSVSKLKPKTHVFYDFLEVASNSNIFEGFKTTNIKSLYITPNCSDILYCYELLRENSNDEYIVYNNLCEELYKTINGNNYDFMFYEIEPQKFNDLNSYIINLVDILLIILKCQSENGVCIIKIDNVFYKPIIDILYIFTSLYDKTIIIKPNTSKITTFEKYVICKTFIKNETKRELYKNYYHSLKEGLTNYKENLNIDSIIDQDIPYYFINKIDDMNNIIGQQQLESITQLINVIKNKNKDDKMEAVKKSNIQKSVNWCEKFKIPCNKFSEKVNIFLPITKDETLFTKDETLFTKDETLLTNDN